jgi:chloramphenicol 3-O-phosphotransferase
MALAAALVAVIAAGGARAAAPPADSHTEAAMELLNITMSDEQVARTVEPMTAMFAGPDQAKTARMQAAARDAMMKVMPAYRQALAPSLVQVMPEKDMREAVAYFKQPVYARYKAQIYAVLAEALPQSMKLMMDAAAQAMAKSRAAKPGAKDQPPEIPLLPEPKPMDSHMKAAADLYDLMLKSGMQGGDIQKVLNGQGVDGKPIPPEFKKMLRTVMADSRIIMIKAFYDHYSEADLKAFQVFFSAPIYRNTMAKMQMAVRDAGPKANQMLLQATMGAMGQVTQSIQQGGAKP